MQMAAAVLSRDLLHARLSWDQDCIPGRRLSLSVAHALRCAAVDELRHLSLRSLTGPSYFNSNLPSSLPLAREQD